MKKIIFCLLLVSVSATINAQKIDSIFFHLYTDSLKKGTHNYINVDGKMSDGSWKPLTTKEVLFSSSAGEFSGNELIIPADFKEEKITVKAVLKKNHALAIEKTIWIKTIPDPEMLPTKEDVLKEKPKKKK